MISSHSIFINIQVPKQRRVIIEYALKYYLQEVIVATRVILQLESSKCKRNKQAGLDAHCPEAVPIWWVVSWVSGGANAAIGSQEFTSTHCKEHGRSNEELREQHRASTTAAPQSWNSLPVKIRQASSQPTPSENPAENPPESTYPS